MGTNFEFLITRLNIQQSRGFFTVGNISPADS